jgi:hypothetical protein
VSIGRPLTARARVKSPGSPGLGSNPPAPEVVRLLDLGAVEGEVVQELVRADVLGGSGKNGRWRRAPLGGGRLMVSSFERYSDWPQS